MFSFPIYVFRSNLYLNFDSESFMLSDLRFIASKILYYVDFFCIEETYFHFIKYKLDVILIE